MKKSEVKNNIKGNWGGGGGGGDFMENFNKRWEEELIYKNRV